MYLGIYHIWYERPVDNFQVFRLPAFLPTISTLGSNLTVLCQNARYRCFSRRLLAPIHAILMNFLIHAMQNIFVLP